MWMPARIVCLPAHGYAVRAPLLLPLPLLLLLCSCVPGQGACVKLPRLPAC